MAIPLALTNLTIQRVIPVAGDDDVIDGYDVQGAPQTIATGIRATIGQPSASVVLVGGDRVVTTASFSADPCSIQAGDTVIDNTGTVWMALWARTVNGLGLDHTQGELRLVEGAT